MRHRNMYKVIALLLLIITAGSFTYDNPYFKITANDVVIQIPKGFPKPIYDLKHNPVTPEGFVLGRQLFYDPILSKDSSISCASCHQRFAAFAHIDHALSHGINGLIGKRNVPAIQNVIWESSFMWDGGINHVELQPVAPITNPIEMNETLAHVIMKLQRNKEYAAEFNAVFHDKQITGERLLKALAQYLALMISDNAPFDKYMRGEDTISVAAVRGFKLFGERCANCHAGMLFTDNSFRNIGLKMDTALRDSGRQHITGLQADYMKYKVPSLRNVALTYPYMHDGRFRNLQQVLDYYATGNFTGDYDRSLNKVTGLSITQRADIIAFLKTLTDKEFVYDRRFDDPNKGK